MDRSSGIPLVAPPSLLPRGTREWRTRSVESVGMFASLASAAEEAPQAAALVRLGLPGLPARVGAHLRPAGPRERPRQAAQRDRGGTPASQGDDRLAFVDAAQEVLAVVRHGHADLDRQVLLDLVRGDRRLGVDVVDD